MIIDCDIKFTSAVISSRSFSRFYSPFMKASVIIDYWKDHSKTFFVAPACSAATNIEVLAEEVLSSILITSNDSDY